MLVGRSEAELRQLAVDGRHVVAATPQEIADHLQRQSGIVVCNCVGPFTETAGLFISALGDGSCYLDLSNDILSWQSTVALAPAAVKKNQRLVPGAGYGTYAVEALVLFLLGKREAPLEIRVDSIPYINSPGAMGMTVAATMVDSIPTGGAAFIDGQLKRVPFGSRPSVNQLPDGSSASAGAVATGDLMVAQRASKAANIVVGSSMAPASALVRWTLWAIAPLFRISAFKVFITKLFAKMPGSPTAQTRTQSWVHAKIRWQDGAAVEGLLELGEGMQFTAQVAATVSFHVATKEGPAGVFSVGDLFGTSLAVELGGRFQ